MLIFYRFEPDDAYKKNAYKKECVVQERWSKSLSTIFVSKKAKSGVELHWVIYFIQRFATWQNFFDTRNRAQNNAQAMQHIAATPQHKNYKL